MHHVHSELRDGATVLSAAGELDAFAAPELSSALREASTSPSRVVVDLGGATFVDSTVLGLVVRTMRELAAAGVGTRLVLPRGTARRIFEITALDKALPVAETLEAALADLEL